MPPPTEIEANKGCIRNYLRQLPRIYNQPQRNWSRLATIKAVVELSPSKNIREGLQSGLAYIHRFISNLSYGCQLCARLIKEDVYSSETNNQNTWNSIIMYLTKHTVMVSREKLSILHIVVLDHSLKTLLAKGNTRKGRAKTKKNLYYLSRTSLIQRKSNPSSRRYVWRNFIF